MSEEKQVQGQGQGHRGHRHEWILNNLNQARTIVDIGGRDAFMWQAIAKYGLVKGKFYDRLVGVDVDDYGKHWAELGCEFVQADAQKPLPFKDGEFEVAIVGDILEDVKDPVSILREAKRIAKRVIFTTPDEYNWDEVLNPFKSPNHQRFYDTELLCQDLEKAGLTYEVGLLEYDKWAFFCGVAE